MFNRFQRLTISKKKSKYVYTSKFRSLTICDYVYKQSQYKYRSMAEGILSSRFYIAYSSEFNLLKICQIHQKKRIVKSIF